MGAPFTQQEDEKIWNLRYFAKCTNEEIREKFGYSFTGITEAIKRHTILLRDQFGINLTDYEANDIKLFTESRAILSGILHGEDKKAKQDIAKFLFRELNPVKKKIIRGPQDRAKLPSGHDAKELGSAFQT